MVCVIYQSCARRPDFEKARETKIDMRFPSRFKVQEFTVKG